MRRILFDVPRWHVYLHREARSLPTVDKGDRPVVQLEDELFDRFFSGGGEPAFDADDTPLAQWAKKIHDTCSQLPVFDRLSQECMGDSDAAATAVETVMAELGPKMEQPPGDVDDAALRKALMSACEKSSGAIDQQRETKEALSGIGFKTAGKGSSRGGPMEQPGPRKLAVRLAGDDRLKRIALLAGRFKRIAARKQRAKVKHGQDEVTDIEMGSELSRLLPVELAGLLHPRRRMALMRDLVEHRALQYRMEGSESLGKGPLVVCLDKSGSMSGPSDIWATAVALALLEVAHRQRRQFALLAFDARVKHEVIVKPGEPLPEEALFTACAGGTEICRVLARGLEIIRTNEGSMKKADIVLITDGASETNEAPFIRQLAAGLGVTVLGFGIGVEKVDLDPWCDEVQTIKNATDDMDDITAEKLFAI
jgi:Mg-chelatase subunit ChlD